MLFKYSAVFATVLLAASTLAAPVSFPLTQRLASSLNTYHRSTLLHWRHGYHVHHPGNVVVQIGDAVRLTGVVVPQIGVVEAPNPTGS